MIDSIKEIINDVLIIMEEELNIPNTEEARDLVFETGMAESHYKNIEQIGGGPGLGFFQCEINTCYDIWENFVVFRKPYIETLYKLGLVEDRMTFCLLTNIALQVAFCRIHYRRQPGAIPKSLPARANYWLKYYNAGGKGSVDHYVGANMGVE
jgi:hypothetical protein